MDLPDEETVESADATPGADADTSTGTRRTGGGCKRFAARARQLEGAGDRKLQLIEQTTKELLLDGFNPVIFCRFIDTAEYVAEHLSRRLGDRYAVAAVTGTLPPDERMARIDRPDAADETKRPVLVATDCLSEGVNLQEHFQAVVHYDLAWNPTRHEQREGRVDRFGQRRRDGAGRHHLRRGQRHRRHRPGRAAPQARADPQGPRHLRPGAGPLRRRGGGDPGGPAAARRGQSSS